MRPFPIPCATIEARRMIEQAAARNRERDAVDRGSGFASPGDCAIDEQLRTVLTALGAGLSAKDWNCVAEAIDMLQRAEMQVRSR